MPRSPDSIRSSAPALLSGRPAPLRVRKLAWLKPRTFRDLP